MILVYTPGRVGTCAIQDTLKRDTDEHIVSLHSFTPNESLDGLPDDNVAVEKNKVRGVLEELSCNRRILTITAVRDPIERAISSFSFFRHHYPEWTGHEKAYFLKSYNHDWCLNWFDNEAKAFFGLDVYKRPWEAKHYENWGYYKSNTMELIIVKFPHLNALRESMDVMWNIRIGHVAKNNMIQCKPERVKGYIELRESKFPKEYVDRMYDNKFVRHFWTPDEIAALKNKWSE